MPTVAEHLEHNRKELLDLSTRNRLLSIPKTSKSARLIHIVDERSDQIYRLLAGEKKAMTFLPGRKSAQAELGEEGEMALPLPLEAQSASADEEEDGISKRHKDSRLQTGLTPEGLQRRLLSLFTDAKTVEEEQGISILYLSLGQLEWVENSEEKTTRFAPLLLLPVTLTRGSVAEKFKLQWSELDLQENLSLAAKLKNDFDIELPEFGDSEDFDPSSYFNAIAKAVKEQSGWKVLPNEMTLGFFSFAKLMMFRDLDPENWPEEKRIDQHGLVASLLADGFDRSEPPFGENSHLDEVIPVELLDHVVDADGSQTEVIEVVRRGRNLVVQGPPGTGKSQTICNILSMAVLDGKRVLFVAEKSAALDVVKRRLTANGLGALCLELHSRQANKRAVLEDLRRTWELGRPTGGSHSEALARLKQLREKLNSHCVSLHSAMEPCGMSPFRIIGELTKLKEVGTEAPQLEFENSNEWNTETTKRNRRIVEELTDRVAAIGSPSSHAWRGVRRKLFLRIDSDPLLRVIGNQQADAELLVQAIRTLSEYLKQEEPDSLMIAEGLLLLADHIAKAPDLDKDAICSSVWNAGLDGLQDVIFCGQRFSAIVTAQAATTAADAWAKDLIVARKCISEHGKSLFRILNKEYREAFWAFKSCLLVAPPKTYDERIALLDQILSGQELYRKIRSNSAMGTSAFGRLWQEERSNWDQLTQVLAWVEAHPSGLGASFRRVLSTVTDNEQVKQLAATVRSASSGFDKSFAALNKELDLDPLQAFGASQNSEISLSDLQDRFDTWRWSIDQLPDWIAYHARADELRTVGAGSLVAALWSKRLPGEKLLGAFDWTYFTSLLREVVRQHPYLGTFDGVLHGQIVEEFRLADRERLELAKLKTLAAHYEQMPLEGDGVGVTGIIRSEMAKKRSHMPIRKLLKHTGHAIQRIKPIFMMSPLSVAQYLEPGSIDFDLLVIDEASQVEPVDALGAIARCKQIVVVGDSKQLPPSHFFMRMTTESDEEDFDAGEGATSAKDIESVLGLCLARGVAPKMLRWHYRSRHHSLIAVSNHEFYDDKLFIVPSPCATRADLGLRFNFVPDGIFDSGGTAVNRIEAQTVAQAILDHAAKYPAVTLGVAAFSIRQRQAIEDELELLRHGRPDTESFFNAHPNEPFFIKNLENVQGDERDVIFISIGYARDSSGYLAMNFGPLKNEGGERRLNVLISRAKVRCEVFSSIRSDDIDLGRAKGRGVAALKSYLRYAEMGQLGVARATRGDEDSPFEEAVRRELEAHGLEIDTQVGEAGFFIDLAVRDSEVEGSYILGIECDGAAYHSSRSARDRDRLRQAVLEDHGWIIHRIWSTDWFQRPDRALRNTLLAVEEARAHRGGRLPSKTAPAPAEQEVARSKPDDEESEAPLYEIAHLDLPNIRFDLSSMTPGQLIRHVARVLEIEAPISLEEVVIRIRDGWGYERAGNRIQDVVEKALRLAMDKSTFANEEGFIVNRARPPVPRRRDDSLPLSLKKIENIAPCEIRAGITLVVERNLGVGTDELETAVARLFGFKTTGVQIRNTIQSQIRKLVRGGVLTTNGGMVRRSTSANEGTRL
jgi:very-short-patch-repair endonuclease